MLNMTQWNLLTTIGLAGGIVAALLVGKPLDQLVGAMIVTAILTCLVGAFLGGMQAVYLRQLLARPIWWVVATVAGMGIGLAVGAVLVEQVGTLISGHRPQIVQLTPALRALSFAVLGLVSGTILGFSQWLVLRRQRPTIQRWIPTSAVALALAFPASSLIVDAFAGGIASPVGLITFVLASGLAFGAITSGPLRRAV
ncbi:MAG TPA: hypothetical protein VII12_05130 [Thermoanaerobaculia bacterium]